MEERVGNYAEDGRVTTLEVLEFGNFVEELELVDLPLLGRKFTWYHASGRSMSRIDRALISDEWAQRWGNVALWAMPRDVSDHCPLILKYCHDDWGPKPFRFNNFWFSKRLLNLLGVVKGWRGGWGMF
jgi:hypothetical protein